MTASHNTYMCAGNVSHICDMLAPSIPCCRLAPLPANRVENLWRRGGLRLVLVLDVRPGGQHREVQRLHAAARYHPAQGLIQRTCMGWGRGGCPPSSWTGRGPDLPTKSGLDDPGGPPKGQIFSSGVLPQNGHFGRFRRQKLWPGASQCQKLVRKKLQKNFFRCVGYFLGYFSSGRNSSTPLEP